MNNDKINKIEGGLSEFFSEFGMSTLRHIQSVAAHHYNSNALTEDAEEFNYLSQLVAESGSFDCLTRRGKKAFLEHFSTVARMMLPISIPREHRLNAVHLALLLEKQWSKQVDPVSIALEELMGEAV